MLTNIRVEKWGLLVKNALAYHSESSMFYKTGRRQIVSFQKFVLRLIYIDKVCFKTAIKRTKNALIHVKNALKRIKNVLKCV